MWNIKRWLILATLPVASALAAAPATADSPLEQAAQKAAAIHIDDATQHHVEDLVKTVQSPEYQQKIEHYRELLLRAGGVEFTPAGQTAATDKASDADTLSSNARLYVFISSSVPEATLRRYVRDVAKLKQGVLVLRGFIGGAHTVKPTVQFIANLLKKDPACQGLSCPLHAVEVQIDPLRFTRYAIERVPALVYEPNESFLGYCDPTSLSQATASLVVYGDARLQYALERYYEAQPAPGLSSLIARLEPVPWEHRALPKSPSSP
ncbi:MAG: type-F conjugative transfer system pilin assembly protein TrbC [Gammaproteobacteria bacterium]